MQKSKFLTGKATAVVSGIVNSFLAISKIIAGIFTNSSALLADGIHSLTDLLSDFFTYVMLHISQGDADETHPYGHGKFDTFGAFFIAGILFITGIGIMWQGVNKYLEGHMELAFGEWALFFAFVSIVANEGLFFYCKHVGEKIRSRVIVANAWHHRTDSLSSVTALIGIGGSMAGYPFLDVFAAIVISIILCKAAWDIGSRSFNELVDGAVEKSTIKKIGKLVLSQEGVKSMHHLRARTIGADIFVDIHVEVDPYISVSEGHAISENVEHCLKDNIETVNDVVVHIDPYNEESGPYPEKYSRKKLENNIYSIVKTITPKAEVHKITLHLLRAELSAEICFKSNTKVTSSQAKEIQTLLQKKGFVQVSLSVLVR